MFFISTTRVKGIEKKGKEGGLIRVRQDPFDSIGIRSHEEEQSEGLHTALDWMQCYVIYECCNLVRMIPSLNKRLTYTIPCTMCSVP